MDLVFAFTSAGTTIKFLTIVDDGSHYCFNIVASGQLGAAEMIRALQEWLAQAGVRSRFIEPGSLWQPGVNESSNGRFRDECLNREFIGRVLEA